MRYGEGTAASKLSWSFDSSGRGGGGASISNLASAACSVKSSGTYPDESVAYYALTAHEWQDTEKYSVE